MNIQVSNNNYIFFQLVERAENCLQLKEELSKKLNYPIEKREGSLPLNISNVISDKKIDFFEIKEVCQWNKEYLQDELKANTKGFGTDSLLFAIEALLQAIILKKQFEKKYPSKQISFNPNYTITDSTFNPTRNWLLINGINAKVFETNANQP